MNWRYVLTREIKQLFLQDPKRAMYLFGACALYILLFGLLYGPHVISAVPIAIYDEDQTSVSRSVIQAFDDSERYQIIAYAASREELEGLLHEKQVQATITIPIDFSRNIKTGHSPSVLVDVNGTNLIISNSVLSSAQEIIQVLSSKAATMKLASTGQLPEQAFHKAIPVTLGMRILSNSTLSYLDFFVLGLAMAALQQGIFLAVGASMIYEYQNLHELQEVPTFQVIAGKLLPYWFFGTLSFIMALALSSLAFHVPLKGDYTSLLALGTVFSFTATALASVIAATCQDEVSFTQFSLAYTVPAFIFSGYTWPQHAMDTLSMIISSTFPLTYFADTVRSLMITGHAPALQNNILILLLIGSTLLIISTLLYSNKRNSLLLSK